MGRYYLLLTQCAGTCGIPEALHVLGDVCGLYTRIVERGIVETTCEDPVKLLKCSSRVLCVRYVVEEVSRHNLEGEWRKALEEALEAAAEVLLRRSSTLLAKEGRVRVNVEVSDPAQRLGTSERVLIREKLLELLRARNARLLAVRTSPDLDMWVGILDKYLVVGVVLQKFRGDRYRSREPHRRVYRRPFALVPQVARLLFNFSLSSLPGPFLDAFCGTGALLIEAALEGLYGVGVDIAYENIRGTRRNAMQHNVYHSIDLIIGDAAYLPFRNNSFAMAAFDPPYGRDASCKGNQPYPLLRKALERVVESLKMGSRAAFLSPGSDEYLALAEVAENICSIYVCSSLTRVLWVLKKDH